MESNSGYDPAKILFGGYKMSDPSYLPLRFQRPYYVGDSDNDVVTFQRRSHANDIFGYCIIRHSTCKSF